LKQEQPSSEVIQVYYLQKRLKEGGEKDGSNPQKLALPLKSVQLPPLPQTRALEERLKALELRWPMGDQTIWLNNSVKWRAVLEPYLVDAQTAIKITGGEAFCTQYNTCLIEREKNYKFVDTSRFQLHGC